MYRFWRMLPTGSAIKQLYRCWLVESLSTCLCYNANMKKHIDREKQHTVPTNSCSNIKMSRWKAAKRCLGNRSYNII